MNAIILLSFLIAGVQAFTLSSSRMTRTFLKMNEPMKPTSPGRNLKPQADGTFAEAGAHPKTYGLAHENGSKAVVDTKTATCISWKDVSGTELIGSAAIAHQFPTSTTPLKGEFIPEERAKKVSFDRMIFKVTPEGKPEIEYRADVTMRADSLEYDVVVKNYGASTHKVSLGLLINLSDAAKKLGYKVTSKKGYTSGTDFSVATGEWEVPVGKLKETEFYVKISK